MELLSNGNLIEVHEALNEFATHHYNRGGQDSHRLIKKEFTDDRKRVPINGTEQGLLINEGYQRALSDVLAFLRKIYVP